MEEYLYFELHLKGGRFDFGVQQYLLAIVLCLGNLDNWHHLMKLGELYEGGIVVPTKLHFAGDLPDIHLNISYKDISKSPMNEFRTKFRMHY